MPANPYEIAGRRRKAEALAAIIREYDGTTDTAMDMTEEDWQNAAKLAQVKDPSDATRWVVIRMLRGW